MSYYLSESTKSMWNYYIFKLSSYELQNIGKTRFHVSPYAYQIGHSNHRSIGWTKLGAWKS